MGRYDNDEELPLDIPDPSDSGDSEEAFMEMVENDPL